MSTCKRLAGLLLLTTSLTIPTIAHAQAVEPQSEEELTADELTAEVEEAPPEEGLEESDVSIPGGGIVVTGKRGRNPERSSTQVLNVLSEADIARTGEGDIAGALSRVSGLSLVGNGRVFVRGLGDRYSLALLNGLPLPSPEPLSRVVPLDIFPTSVVSSSLVQKTYSANFPGEFGGGVINLTTKAVPTENFLNISFGGSGDTETTFENGLTYFGSRWDTFGFDNGNRDIPSNLQSFFDSGQQIQAISQEEARGIAGQLFPTNLVTLQKNDSLPMNFSANITGGLTFDLGGETYLGVVATAGISNKWRNRSVLSQSALGNDFSTLEETRNTFITDNNVLVNALIGFGLDIGEHTIRWTNLYIRDTLKTARLTASTDFTSFAQVTDFSTQQTAWFERQLIDTQLVGEFEFDRLDVDVRGGYARTDREAPYNTTFEYVRTNTPGEVLGNEFAVNIGNTRGAFDRPEVGFDDLKEEQYFGGIDLSYEVLDNLDTTIGYSYTDTERRSSSRAFVPTVTCGPVCNEQLPDVNQSTSLINALGLRRPGDIINGATIATDATGRPFFNIALFERSQFPVFDAALTVHGVYGQVRWIPIDPLTVEFGVRYEDAKQTVTLDQSIFTTPVTGASPTNITNDYFLPATTITWAVTDDLQVRFAASQTIARPQFRELVEQLYFDPESNRRYVGNPFLQDSELINVETRAEYYFGGPNRKVSLAGFYKEIDNPIENILLSNSGDLRTSFANAPSAELYGVELDVAYGFDLFDWGGFFETKQLLVLANYTYANSTISVGADDVVLVPGGGTDPVTGLAFPQEIEASQLFDDGAPLVGQSDHVANLSIGLEDTEKVQQFTFFLNYASERVTLRGGPLPDVVEEPGLTVDFVARSEFNLGGLPLEFSAEVRNIFGRDNFEYQELDGNRIEVNTFDVGTTFALGVKASF